MSSPPSSHNNSGSNPKSLPFGIDRILSPEGPPFGMPNPPAAFGFPGLDSQALLQYFMSYMMIQQQQQVQQQQIQQQIQQHLQQQQLQRHLQQQQQSQQQLLQQQLQQLQPHRPQLQQQPQSHHNQHPHQQHQLQQHRQQPQHNQPPQVHQQSQIQANHNQKRRPSPSGTKTKSHEIDVGDAACTALSSLTNFVSNSLAPFLEEDLVQSRGRKRSPALSVPNHRSSSGGHQQKSALDLNSGTNHNNNDFSGNESSHEDDRSSLASSVRISKSTTANGSSKPANAPAAALKASPTVPTVASTINTTLAKAPLELVQKQPAWVFCTRYSDRPSSGPRTRRAKSRDKKPKDTKLSADEKRPRTAFTSEQLEKLREEFQANSYLDEKRRKSLAERLCLNENQIKIWFQNKRAKMKKQSNQPNPLRGLLVAGGLYNHSTATSDCSESYANGLADDIGNRIIRDVELEGGGGAEDEEENGEGQNRGLKNVDRLMQVAGRSLKSLNDRAAGRGDDQDNNNREQAAATGDSKGPAAAAAGSQMSATKRRHTSQSDGDDEDDDNMGNSSAVIKRTKLSHMERNHNQRLAISHANLSRLVAGNDIQLGSGAPIGDHNNGCDQGDEDEQVISVS